MFCALLSILPSFSTQALASEVLKLELILPLSGVQETKGKDMRLGIEMAATYLKAHYQIETELTWHDSTSSHLEAGKFAKQIQEQDEKPHAVIGSANDLSAAAIKLHLEQAGVPMIFPLLQNPQLLRGSRFAHTMSVGPSSWSLAAWDLSKNHLRAQRVLLLMPIVQGGIDEFLAVFQKTIGKKAKLKVLSYGGVENIEKILDEATQFKPDVVWLPWIDSNFEAILKGFRTRSWTRPFIGFEDWDFKKRGQALGAAWTGNYMLRMYSADLKTDLAKAFQKLIPKEEAAVGKEELPKSAAPRIISDDTALAFEATLLAGLTHKKAAYRAKGLSFVKVLRHSGKFEGLAGTYKIRPDGQIERPVLKVETTSSGESLLLK